MTDESQVPTRDGLTKLPNYAALQNHMQMLQARAASDVAALVLDIDHFKRINDAYGHEEGGNRILVEVASVLSKVSGRYHSAFVARQGGDEFAVILDGYTLQEAIALAEHLRTAVAAVRVEGIPLPVALTIGVAASPMSSLAEVINHADTALVEAKHQGRNRVEAYHEGTLRRQTRRVILNPCLFETLGKTLRLAFMRTRNYHFAAMLIQKSVSAPLKCMSVLGQHDMLLVHLGDNEHRFNADVQPFMLESGIDQDAARHVRHFVATKILKFHGYKVGHEIPDVPSPETLQKIVVAAQGGNAPDDAVLQQWLDAGYINGLEPIELRAGEIETYIMVAPAFDGDNISETMFERLMTESVMDDSRVFSLYQGHSHDNLQYVIRTRSTPGELFAFLESFHEKCMAIYVPVHTNTHVVLSYKALRVYENLLIPVLTEDQKQYRDGVIMPTLTKDEGHQFLFGTDLQPEVIAKTKRITDGLRKLVLPADVIEPQYLKLLSTRAVSAIVQGNIQELKQIFTTFTSILERGLRERLDVVIATHFHTVADAVRAEFLSTAMGVKGAKGFTLGEARDCALRFHRRGHVAAADLPSREALDALTPIISLRNKFVHAQEASVHPAEAISFLPVLLDILRTERARLFLP